LNFRARRCIHLTNNTPGRPTRPLLFHEEIEMLKRAMFAVLATGTLLAVGCADDSTEPVEAGLSGCGIVACTANDNDDDYDPSGLPAENNPKSDAVDRVRSATGTATADGVLDVADLETIWAAAGDSVSKGELEAVHEALLEETAYTVTPEAIERGDQLALTANIAEADETEVLLSGSSFAGTELPDAVRNLLITARWHGAVAFDVNETDDDGEGIWSPYPATTPPRENMTFAYTEITPEKLIEDLEDTEVEYNAIVGTEKATTPSGQEYEQVRYEQRKGGTGHIMAQYDEVYHPDIYARGSQNQKWANNFAILSDGTVHCLPAARRSYIQDLILTNPHLSRGQHMLFNGHLDVRAGVVVGVEMSGRLSKIAAKGKATFVDPIALLKAWGFEIAPGVTLRYGNVDAGAPSVNAEGFVLEQASN